MITRLYIGVDISKRWFDVFYVLGKNEVQARYRNDEEGWREFVRAVRDLARRVQVCLEHTGGYETGAALAFKAAGFIVSLVDGAKIKYYGRSFSATGKGTDRHSAYLLARYARERKPEEWFPLPDEYRKLKELVRHRLRLIESKIEWACRAAHRVEDELVAAQRLTVVSVHEAQLKEIEQRIREHVRAHPNLKRDVDLLDTIPGIDVVSACRILGETGPIENYPTPRAYALAAGLAPIVVHSGTRTPDGRLPVYGNRELRCGLYFPAVVCYGKKIGVWAFMEKVSSHGDKMKMTVITAGMRKLAHLVWGILTTQQPYDPAKLEPKA